MREQPPPLPRTDAFRAVPRTGVPRAFSVPHAPPAASARAAAAPPLRLPHAPRDGGKSETWGWPHIALAPRPALRAADVLRNLLYGLAAAGGIGFAETLLLPPIIVSAFIVSAGGGYGLVALAPVIGALGWWLAGAVTGRVVARRDRAVPLAAVALLLWAVCTGSVAAFAGARYGGTAAGFLAAFFAAYTLAAVAGGFARISTDHLPERVTMHAARGAFVRGQGIAALGGGIFAAFVAARTLTGATGGVRGVGVVLRDLAPFLTLFSLAALALCAAAGCTLALAEQARRGQQTPHPSLPVRRAAPELLRLPEYARYLAYRVIALFAAVAEPFTVAYAVRDLRIAPNVIGAALVAFVVARAVALVGGRLLSDAGAGRLALQLGTLCRLLAAAVVVALPVLGTTASLGPWLGTSAARDAIVLFACACLGAARGATAAGSSYLRDLLPPVAYPAAVACTNGVLAVTSIALLAGGVVAEVWGITAVFVAALVLGVLTLLIGGLLPSARRPRPHPAPRRASFPNVGGER